MRLSIHDARALARCGALVMLAAATACDDDNGAAPSDAAPVDAPGRDGPPTDAGAIDAGPADAAIDGGPAPDAAVAPVIVSPPPGAELRARRQTFTWTGGTDCVLRVGTTAGGAELFESPPLGDATSATVDGLPLSGVTLYVELTCGAGATPGTATATYLAPVRRALAVIVDYADVRLEDWAGPGVRSPDDLAPILRELEAHWAFLGRGLERVEWEILRIQLPVALSLDAYPGWPEFREAVAAAVLDEVALADHDVDGDGVLDAIWAINADQGIDPPFAIGGASRNGGANLFVDGQASGSLIARAIGNFTHEFAHTLGVPDLYGPYGTVNDLTVMANSWALPPHDLTAYERIFLGWVEPEVIAGSAEDVVLPSAHEHLVAAKLPTSNPEEYFLIEYRQRPDAGFGSAVVEHDGLAVYHVLETSDQWTDPPFVLLEPADGEIVPDRPTEAGDFLAPENPDLLQPLILFSHLGGFPVLEISDVRRTADGGMSFDVVRIPEPSSPPTNLVANPGVEAGPEGWTTRSHKPDAAFAWAPIGAGGDSAHSLGIVAPTENDAEWATRLEGLAVGRGYYLCGYLTGQDVTGGAGATMALSGSFTHARGRVGTFDWTRSCVAFRATDTAQEVACRLGNFGAMTQGQMWCDDVSVIALRSAFRR